MVSSLIRFGFVRLAAILVAGLASLAYAADGAGSECDQAYKLLALKDYDGAVAHFRAALAQDSAAPAVHQDLAYTLLKMGENAAARDEFAAAARLKPSDEQASLEFAFLAYETGKPIEARRTFDRLRQHGSALTRATAQQAFDNIDRPLAGGIAQWKEALARSADPNAPALFSAHWELANTAEKRDDLPLAAEQYLICRKLKPQMPEILLCLARVWQQLNRVEDAHAALLAASRNSDVRTAEAAHEQLGTRYPYAYEFVNALAMDAQNVALRRELAFLYLAVGKEADAVAQFRKILTIDPSDQLSSRQLATLQHKKDEAEASPAQSGASLPVNAREMGFKSLALGYSRDAIRYLSQAQEEDPDDAEIALRLGYAYNYAHDDFDAIRWFDRARQSSDPAIAAEATRAFHNLRGDPVAQTTLWALPMYSSRWHDAFSYGQIKRTVPLPWSGLNHWFSLYFSARYAGDWKSSLSSKPPGFQYLSESSVVFGSGVASRTWHHATLWAEAGESVKYLPFRHDIGTALPDYRGGLTYVKGFGHMLGGPSSGSFFETTIDADYVSRFDKNWFFGAQSRAGHTFVLANGYVTQLGWNFNILQNLKNEYWAQTAETGPSFRLHTPWMLPGVYLSTDLLHGVYLNNADNPRRPNYDDVRVGFWYAFTK